MALRPDEHDFYIWKGATFRARVELFTDETETTPRDLTNHTADLVIRKKAEDDALLTLTTANGRIVLGGAAGTIDLILPADETAAITWKSGVYDLLIAAPGGDTDAILYGTFYAEGV
jgi:hypothetical protein